MSIFYLRFSLQLMICESIFVLSWGRRKYFFLRLLLCFAAFGACLYGLSVWRIGRFGGMVKFFLMFLLTLPIMAVCFRINLKNILFSGTGGYALQHSVYCISTVIMYFTGSPHSQTAGEYALEYIFVRFLPYARWRPSSILP